MPSDDLGVSVQLKFAKLRIGSLAWACFQETKYSSQWRIPVFKEPPSLATGGSSSYDEVPDRTPLTIIDVNVDGRGQILFYVLFPFEGHMKKGWVWARMTSSTDPNDHSWASTKS